ncbi:MAG: ABC transporter substrate-binding protein [Roseiflexaceae bacterium]
MMSRSSSMRLWLCAALLVVLVLSACGSAPGGAPAQPAASGAKGNATITISLNADPPSLDPAFSSALVDRQVHNSLYDKLLDLDKDGKFVPMLATEWKASDDGLAYTFTLREGIKFHDGTNLDAEAVKFNLERYMTDPKSTRRNELGAVASVEVVDAKTLKVTLKERFAPFLSVLTDRSGMIVSPKSVQDQSGDIRNQPVGSGPFKYDSRIKGDTITLIRNEEYWQPGLPKAAKVVYKILTDPNIQLVNLRSGQIDVTDGLPAQEVPNLQNDKNFVVVNASGFGYQGIWINTTAAPLDNKQVRQAIDILMDRDQIVKVLFNGTATAGNSPFSSTNLAFGDSDKYSPPNLEQAKQLLAQSGTPNPSFTLKVGTSAIQAQFAQLVQNFLKPAGIDMQIEKVEFGTLLDQMTKGNYQAAFLGWSGRPDPDQNIYDFFVTGGAQNNSAFSNPQVDEQLKAARQESDPAKRKASYDQVMQTLHDQVPYVFLYHANVVLGMSSKISGYTFVPDGIIRTVAFDKQQ